MGLTGDDFRIRIGRHRVEVRGRTGLVAATWTLLVDGAEAASGEVVRGELPLETVLPDGTAVRALVRQGAFGPTEVVILDDGEELTRFRGYVA